MHQEKSRLTFYINHNLHAKYNMNTRIQKIWNQNCDSSFWSFICILKSNLTSFKGLSSNFYEYNLYLRTIVLAYSLSIFTLKCKSTDQEDKEDEWYQK